MAANGRGGARRPQGQAGVSGQAADAEGVRRSGRRREQGGPAVLTPGGGVAKGPCRAGLGPPGPGAGPAGRWGPRPGLGSGPGRRNCPASGATPRRTASSSRAIRRSLPALQCQAPSLPTGDTGGGPGAGGAPASHSVWGRRARAAASPISPTTNYKRGKEKGLASPKG